MIARLFGRRPRRAAAPAPQPAPRPVAQDSAIAQADLVVAAAVSMRRALGRTSQGHPVDEDRLAADMADVLVHTSRAVGLAAEEQAARRALNAAAVPDDLIGGAW